MEPGVVARIQRAEYCQYVWDRLRNSTIAQGSILRLDHIFPLGDDPANWQALRDEALDILMEWILWHLAGSIPEGGALECCRTTFAEFA